MRIKSKTRFLFITILSIFCLSIFSGIEIQKANAVAPSFTNLADSSLTNPSTGTTSGWNPSTEVGLTYVLTTTCYPYTAAIYSITDTTGNTWIKIASSQGGYLGNAPIVIKSPSVVTDLWYAVQTTTVSNSITVTVNFVNSLTYCTLVVYVSNVPISLAFVTSTVQATRTFALLGNPARLNTTMTSFVTNLKASTAYVVLNYDFTNSTGSTNFVSFNPSISAVPLTNLANGACTAQQIVQCGVQQGTISASNVATSNIFAIRATSAVATTNTYSMGMITTVWSTTTISTPSCTNCGIGGGGTTKDATTSFSSSGNVTYLYTNDAPNGGALIQNITAEVSSYTNGAAGKSNDFIYICIHTMPKGNLTSNSAVSSANPFKQIYCQVNTAITTGSTNKFIHVYPNIEIQPSTSFTVSIFSRFAGLKIYAAITPATVQADSADPIVSGTPPQNIFNYNSSTPNLYLVWTGSQTAIFTAGTTTITGAVSTITSTSITQSFVYTTSTITNLQGGSGGQAMLDNLVHYFPLWVIPLLFTPFGIQGLMLGTILGFITAGILQIIPLWAAFIMSIIILYLLTRSRI